MSAMDERTAIRSRTRAGLSRLAGPWWMFQLTGIAWLILSWVALRFTPASVPTVGALLGVLFLVAMVNEFFIAAVLAAVALAARRDGHHLRLRRRLVLRPARQRVLFAGAEPTLIWPVSGRPRPGGAEVLEQRRAAGAGRPVCGFVFLKRASILTGAYWCFQRKTND
jgi:hypothetical protein